VVGTGSGGAAATAVAAIASATSGSTIGVHANNASSGGLGVFAYAQATSGNTIGVLGRSASPAGTAVRAWSSATSGNANYALSARNDSADGFAGHFVGGRNYFQGRIGIGLDNPSDRLHVAAPAGESALRVQVDGTTRLRVHANGGVAVGVNTTPPPAGLYVEGPIQTAPVTRWLSIDGRTFTVNNDRWIASDTGGRGGPAQYIRLVAAARSVNSSAPVQLPHGAVITGLHAWVNDSSPDHDVTVRLLRRSHASGAAVQMASVNSTGVQAGVIPLQVVSIGNATVDNQNHAYYLHAEWGAEQTLALAERTALLSVRITYTVSSPTP